MKQSSPPLPRPRRLRSIEPPPHPEPWINELRALEPLGPDLALAFWRMLRRARMWAATARTERKSLAVPGLASTYEHLGNACARAPALLDVFGVFALSMRDPEAVETLHLIAACRRVLAWAEERSYLEIAALFAEAAALVDADSPALSNDAARLYRQLARFDRAACWYERAFGLAARTGNQTEAINALLGYGNLKKDMGDFAQARKYYERVAQRALNSGRRRIAAEAHHSLLALAVETGEYRAAVRHVRKALDHYPIRHPLIPNLVYDFAFLLLRRRHYTLAAGPMVRLLSVIQHPHVHVLIHGAIARVAGGRHNRELYDRSEEAVLALAGDHPQFASSALNGLAEGAWAFGEWQRAEVYAAAALTIARARQDGGEQAVSERLLDSIGRREPPDQEAEPEERQRLEVLLQRLLSRLRVWEAPRNLAVRGASQIEPRPKPTTGYQ